MANEGKRAPQATTAERTRIAQWVRSTSDADAQWITMTVDEVCTILDKNPKTLKRARDARDETLVAGKNPDGTSLASIPYIPPGPDGLAYAYLMSEIKAYWLRRITAAQAAVEAEPIPVVQGFGTVHGFASFMASALPTDTWPFSIQADGRPMDMFLAMELGLLTGKAERLTLREFGDRLSDAASSGFHGSEAAELRNVTRDPSITPFDDGEFEDEDTAEPSSSGTIRV
jgi:hypothetical protein